MVANLSDSAEKRIEELKEIYPDSKSVVMPALFIAQEELGYINSEAVKWVANRLDLSPVKVEEVATFYTMYYKKPVGKYHVQICRTLSCAVCGGKSLSEYIQKRLGVKSGEVTENGFWSFEEVECLGSCGTAPMLEINDTYFENLTPEKLEHIMNRIEREKPDLRYSAVTDSLGQGFKDLPKSEVI